MIKTSESPKENVRDLRDGLRGTLVVHEPNLAGASPQHRVNNPDLLSSDASHVAGRSTNG